LTSEERTCPYIAPAGHHYVAEVDPQWVVLTDEDRPPCRAGAGPRLPACGRPSVAALHHHVERGSAGTGSQDLWWAYCENHLYGHWIDDGQVYVWMLRPVPTPPVEQRSWAGWSNAAGDAWDRNASGVWQRRPAREQP